MNCQRVQCLCPAAITMAIGKERDSAAGPEEKCTQRNANVHKTPRKRLNLKIVLFAVEK